MVLGPWGTPIACSELEGECSSIGQSCCRDGLSSPRGEAVDLMDLVRKYLGKEMRLLAER